MTLNRTEKIIQLRDKKLSLQEVGKIVGLSRERVRQIEAKARAEAFYKNNTAPEGTAGY